MDKAKVKCQRATQLRTEGYAEEDTSTETEIVLKGVPCEMCEHCGALAFEAEKG
jgi:YgiT-type zinc finger domain-containing protein